MKTCKKHIKDPVVCYSDCAGCEMQRLTDERDKLKADNDALRNAYMSSGEREHALRIELASMRSDAERYRFLRGDATNSVRDFCIVKKFWDGTFPDRILVLDDADAEIDAEMHS